MNKAKENQIKDLQAKLSSKKGDSKKLVEIQDVVVVKDSLMAEKETPVAKQKALDDQIETLNKQLQDFNIASSRKDNQISSLEADLQDNIVEFNSLKEKILNLKDEVKDKADLQKQVEELNNKVRSLRKQGLGGIR